MSPSRDRDCRPDHGTNFHLPLLPTTPVIEELLAEGFSTADLAREYEHLRDRYEVSARTPQNLSATAIAAYAVARLPATFAANVEALTQVAKALARWQPQSLLDVGSGLGSSAWAALSVFPTLNRLTLVEDSQPMTIAGRELAVRSSHRVLRDAQWVTGVPMPKLDHAELVIASYVLGELDQPEAAVAEWWGASTGALLVIEPGTPAGYQRILRAREQLVSAGARIAAPCPHEAPCPLPDGRWCHFGVTVTRSRLHRDVKGGTLSSEDEKFSYVAATSAAMPIRPPRLIRQPSRHGGHVRLELCAEVGLVEKTVSKRDADYRAIRKLGWGDAVTLPTSNPIASFVTPHLSAPNFRRLTLSGVRAGANPLIRKAVIRPVEIRGRKQLQIVAYDDRRATTTNVPNPDAPAIANLLSQPFRHVVIRLADEVLEGRVTKRGTLLTSRTPVEEVQLDLRHDRSKDHLIPPDAPFLGELDISVDGRVKPSRRSKYRQINDSIRLLDQAPTLNRHRPLRILDVGCGNAYLTFATVHHLIHNRGIECAVVGIDTNAELIGRNTERAAALGWNQLRFAVSDIKSYEPDVPPDVVMALHACDTAADHALAAMVRWRSDAGFVAPCCHHHVQSQLRRAVLDESDRLLVRDGILRERLGDVLTDATRAAVLRLVGYAVDVVQFVDPEHTPRNTLIRASKGTQPVSGLPEAYETLTRRWAMQPLLGDLLGVELPHPRQEGPE